MRLVRGAIVRALVVIVQTKLVLANRLTFKTRSRLRSPSSASVFVVVESNDLNCYLKGI